MDSSSSVEISKGLLADWDMDEMMFKAILSEYNANNTNDAESSPHTKGPRKQRDHQAAHECLMQNHFDANNVYNDKDFERRFQVSRELFERVAWSLQEPYPFFRHGVDAGGRVGFSTYQKCVVAFYLLATDDPVDRCDEYLKMSDRTARDCLYTFCDALYKLYHEEYLRKLNANDIQQLFEFHEAKHGLPGMLGSLDCMHWHWELCPNAYRGSYTHGNHGVPTVALEAVASQYMWFWHGFFDTPGVHNDIIVIHQSDIWVDTYMKRPPDTSFTVNGTRYKYGYWLTDGIYPEWAVLVKTVKDPQDEKRKLFKQKQELTGKDVERPFGGLKKKLHILKQPSHAWHTRKLSKVMFACLILHNMTLEDLGLNICTYVPKEPTPENQWARVGTDEYFDRILEVQDRHKHHEPKADLTGHLWTNQHD